MTAQAVEDDRRLRVVALSAGGFNTVMQLGVAHALLVLDGKPPDYIVGLSAGAINAAAIAEILHAGANEKDQHARMACATDRLREFVAAYADLPPRLKDAFLPDTLEVILEAPLRPLESPLAFDDERKLRQNANDAKAGLVNLINDVFRIRLTISAATVMVRRVLGWIEAGEKPGLFARLWAHLRYEWGILAGTTRYFFSVSPIVTGLLWAIIRSDHGRQRRQRTGRRTGKSAGDLITRWKWLRFLTGGLKALWRTSFAGGLLVLLWVVALPLRTLWVIATAWREQRVSSRLGRLTSTLWDRVLGFYGLRDGIMNNDVIQQQLVNCFDRNYYGEPPVADGIARALRYDTTANQADASKRKTMAWYPEETGIHVCAIAANVATGNLEVLDGEVPLVDTLKAATAIVPYLPAVKIGDGWYIDGVNVSNQPISPLLDYLRSEYLADAEHPRWQQIEGVDVYPVSALPITKGKWEQRGQTYDGVIDVAERAMSLQAFRDATLEHKMTRIYTALMPEGKAFRKANESTFVRADIHPIELDEPPSLNRQMLEAMPPTEARKAMYATVAAGCRASLQAMAADELLAAARAAETWAEDEKARLRVPATIEAVREALAESADRKMPDTAGSREATAPPRQARPGDDPVLQGGAIFCRDMHRRRGATADVPCVTQTCETCTLHVAPPGEGERAAYVDRVAEAARKLKTDILARQSLSPTPSWPSRGRAGTAARRPPPLSLDDTPNTLDAMRRPLVSLLFGGGVFRGVFHVGALNALNEAGVNPDLVAGSSVGSIIAAMIARALKTPEPEARKLIVSRLAGTFLAIDRVILTDRLADFVRRMTLRAYEMDFSPFDLDRVFRRYESDGTNRYSRRVRKVAAGIERMFYISPYELNELTRLARESRTTDLEGELRRDFQEFFDRGGIGDEILGSEPLRTLIEYHVLGDGGEHPQQVLLEDFEEEWSSPDHPLRFFATTTDIFTGELRTLESRTPGISLLFALLASSAFPAVFRPRRTWELLRFGTSDNLFVDGGLIDNLPLDAVASFLNEVLIKEGARRPVIDGTHVPHLVFTASLEVDKTYLSGKALKKTSDSCRALSGRAKTFSKNLKIDAYAQMQHDLRALYETFGFCSMERPPLDLHVVTVKPKWLCNTFGFHPMLGFKRWKQAASIAHGCASTLGSLYAHSITRAEPWVRHWGINLDDIDQTAFNVEPRWKPSDARGEQSNDDVEIKLRPNKDGKSDGTCWFRKSEKCPFSRDAVRARFDEAVQNQQASKDERAAMIAQLPKIYEACGIAANHQTA